MTNELQAGETLGYSFIRLCWLRESAPGHLEYDGGIPVAKSDLFLAVLGVHPAQPRTTADPSVTLDLILGVLAGQISVDELPQWARRRLAISIGPLATEEHRQAASKNAAVLARMADRILEIAGDASGLEAHLPYIDRRSWSNRFEIFDNTAFVLSGNRIISSGLLTLAERELYNGRLLAAAAVHPEIKTVLTFTWSSQVLTEFVECLLPVAGDLDVSDETFTHVEIDMTLGTSACHAWNVAPREDGIEYFKTHAPVSIALQSALRRWLAWSWLTNLDNFEDRKLASVVLAYLCTRPFPGRPRTDFTYDPLSNKWMPYAFRCARKPCENLLRVVHARLKAKGKDRLAKYFRPARAKAILARVEREQKSIRSLIAAEGVVINHILRLALDLRGATDAMAASHDIPEFIHGLGVRLRRFFHDYDLTGLGSMLLIVGTEALATAMGGDAGIRLQVRAHPVPAAPDPLLDEPAAVAEEQSRVPA